MSAVLVAETETSVPGSSVSPALTDAESGLSTPSPAPLPLVQIIDEATRDAMSVLLKLGQQEGKAESELLVEPAAGRTRAKADNASAQGAREDDSSKKTKAAGHRPSSKHHGVFASANGRKWTAHLPGDVPRGYVAYIGARCALSRLLTSLWTGTFANEEEAARAVRKGEAMLLEGKKVDDIVAALRPPPDRSSLSSRHEGVSWCASARLIGNPQALTRT